MRFKTHNPAVVPGSAVVTAHPAPSHCTGSAHSGLLPPLYATYKSTYALLMSCASITLSNSLGTHARCPCPTPVTHMHGDTSAPILHRQPPCAPFPHPSLPAMHGPIPSSPPPCLLFKRRNHSLHQLSHCEHAHKQLAADSNNGKVLLLLYVTHY